MTSVLDQRICIICYKSFQKRPDETWPKFRLRRICSQQCNGYRAGTSKGRGLPYSRFPRRLRRCSDCRKLFHTSKPTQRFCSILCKDRERYRRRRKVIKVQRHNYYLRNIETIARRNERRRHSIEGKAQMVVRKALVAGKLKKPNCCEGCGRKRKLEGHHPDYSKPLEVKWLCSSCHGKEHRLAIAA